uniref:CSON012963 protein n=1 Tax=Culicoides sonorensis TaxID=179676 RepID=A0A336MAQ8_CULSO
MEPQAKKFKIISGGGLTREEAEKEMENLLGGVDVDNINISEDVDEQPSTSGGSNNNNYCTFCKTNVKTWHTHVTTDKHKDNAKIKHSENVFSINVAFGAKIIAYRIMNDDPKNLDYSTFLESHNVKSNLNDLLKSYLNIHTRIKFNLMLYGSYYKHTNNDQGDNADNGDDENIKKQIVFNTRMTELQYTDIIDELLQPLYENLLSQTEDFQENGSGWSLKKILFIELHINKCQPLSVGSYIPLPEWIRKKAACINPKNTDNECFKWALRAYFLLKELNGPSDEEEIQRSAGEQRAIHQMLTEMSNEEAERIDTTYQMNWGDLEFPINIETDIKKFLSWNNSISLTIYGISEDQNDPKKIVGPLFKSSVLKQHHIHLLQVQDGINIHFCLVKNVSRLVNAQFGGVQRTRYFCDNCFYRVTDENALRLHKEKDCHGVATIMPQKGEKLKFTSFSKELRAPIICYADFEAILEPVEENTQQQASSSTSTAQKLNKHVASSYAYLIKNDAGGSDILELYRGENCADKFVTSLFQNLKTTYENNVLNDVRPMIYTDADREKFERSTKCHICEKEIVGRKVRNHNHVTGLFIGAACNQCNLQYYLSKEVSVFLHNLSKYDAHFFIKELSKINSSSSNISIIPSTDETYISFMKPIEIFRERDPNEDPTSFDKVFLKVIFKDSRRFFPGSLQKLSKNLKSHQFVNTIKHLTAKNYDRELIELLKRKGVFPYEHIKSFANYNETRLPAKSAFALSYDGESKKNISDDDYNYALKVFERARCKNIGDYNDVYLITDVLILCDVFEHFREVGQRQYGLDPAHYYTLPGYSYDSMLKYTKMEIELLSDLEMYNFFTEAIRGGLTQCSKRYAKANNRYMANYSSNHESSYLALLDFNNLYGFSLSESIAYGGFQWLTDNQITRFKVENIPDDGDYGYVLSVDIDYPSELHDEHNELPFFPERKKFGNTEKLCATLENKKNYVVHYRNLKQAMQNGLILKKVHKILKFKQSKWIAPYINLNNTLRSMATSDAEKDLYKLMNNAIFGKSVENVLKRRKIYLCSSWQSRHNRKGAAEYIASGYCKKIKVFDETLIAAELAPKLINLNKPVYIGFIVLELSKLRMYQFHYDLMKKKYNSNNQLELCYMDTDSFLYHIRCDDFYEDMRPIIYSDYPDPKDIRHFDTSNFDNKYGYTSKNKKMLGAMKFETGADPITVFIGIRPKAYYFETEDKNVTKKAKGISKQVSETLTFEDYYNCLRDITLKVRKSVQIFRSDHHTIFTEKIYKTALNGADDKRVILEDGEHTLAYGHYRLNNGNEN